MYWLIVLSLISNVPFFGQGKHLHSSGLEIESLIGGNDTNLREHSYVVGINCNNKNCLCTGSIIDHRFVISAAHCVFQNGNFIHDSIKIIAGINDVSDHQDPKRIEMDVDKTYIPLGFEQTENLNYDNDIAVLRLKHSLRLEENNLQKLSLPTKFRSKFENKQAVLSGFGASKVNYIVWKNGSVQSIISYANTKLHSAEVMILANDKCFDPFVSDSNFCGMMIVNNPDNSSNHHGACDGDSGGPLVYRSQFLVGVLSNTGEHCDSRLESDIYQRVTTFIGFIENAMKDVTNDMLFKNYY